VQVLVTSPHDAAPHKAQAIVFTPAGEPRRRPAIVVSPILGGTQDVTLIAARALARRGMVAAVVLAAESMLDGTADEARLERVLRTAVIDRRRAIDWLVLQPDVDPARIGALGASLGGITTTLLAAVDPRVRASVICIAGGDVADIIVRSDERRIERYVEERLAAGVRDVDDLRARIRAAVLSDPLALAPCVDARRALVFTARWDDVVPPDAQARLVDALGRPERYALPTGHYTSALLLPVILSRSIDFLEARLDE
jgi:dienelactone hydrolase